MNSAALRSLSLALIVALMGCSDDEIPREFPGSRDGTSCGSYDCFDEYSCEFVVEMECIMGIVPSCPAGTTSGSCVPSRPPEPTDPDPCARTAPVDCLDPFTCEVVEEASCTVEGLGSQLSCRNGLILDRAFPPFEECVPAQGCDQPSECTLVESTCCGECGVQSFEGVRAVHREDAEAVGERLCSGVESCDTCEGEPNPTLLATCNAAECVAVDLADTPVGSCEADEDCTLRVAGCCECDGDTSPDALLALSVYGVPEYLGLVCDMEAICDDCAPEYPDTHEAFCDAGQCAMRLVD